jgi:hypothetical protein
MQLLNVLLALGGDSGNQVPKFEVTPAEIALLRAIHGEDAISDIQVIGEVARTSRQERARLDEIYARQQPDGSRRSRELDALFPGVAARLFETIDEIDDLSDDMFKPTARAPRTIEPDPLDHDGNGKKGGSLPKAKRGKAAAPAPEPAPEPKDEDDDGIGEIDDGVGKQDENLFE